MGSRACEKPVPLAKTEVRLDDVDARMPDVHLPLAMTDDPIDAAMRLCVARPRIETKGSGTVRLDTRPK